MSTHINCIHIYTRVHKLHTYIYTCVYIDYMRIHVYTYTACTCKLVSYIHMYIHTDKKVFMRQTKWNLISFFSLMGTFTCILCVYLNIFSSVYACDMHLRKSARTCWGVPLAAACAYVCAQHACAHIHVHTYLFSACMYVYTCLDKCVLSMYVCMW